MRGLFIKGERSVEIKDVDRPALDGHNDILVEVHAVAQNPPDSFSLLGSPGKPGNRLGSDYAGVVIESKSDCVKIGDRVCGMVSGNHSPHQGSFAEYLATSADLTIKIPSAMSFQCASTLGMSLFTAIQALFLKSPLALDPNHTKAVLIWGASTAIGMYAVQLAHISGIKIVATTSERNKDLISSLGAHIVFDYKDADVVEKVRESTNDSVTFAIDCVGSPETLKSTVACASDAQSATVHTVLPPAKDFKAKASSNVVFSLVHSGFAEDLSWANYLFPRPVTMEEMMQERKEAVAFFGYDRGTIPGLLRDEILKTTPIVANSKGLENILPWLLKMEKGEIRAGKVVHLLKE
ncbi:hypothetical protein E3P89_03975 [Wallemia ichthyophaga]|uniref:Enoyl reductase (ER) domain-containing protein n=1 Tax=Wallemia ichthyophaga TaxID=245174 RepID=A0A4T0IQ46_WALIC|nr:hypothetical protein E3P91_04048 [Wallemia ichthyophaga]TIA94846.1 hypothetical protein E3P95_04032 [Wallemia ichthyophaga]TIA95532.1 hypothetical protein E3P94_04021 [Wallemia ichthyophaga]TIB07144.1 hypothetical protein E3P93_03997 [Wallemia ichthyophaga]TIB07651.1 hypothetical protein E3P90_03994 [Wallemia ichthyophaga]